MNSSITNRYFTGAIIPGLAVAAAVAAGAWLMVALITRLPAPLGNLPVSMMLVAILAGLGLGVTARRRPTWTPGLNLARGPILKTAVALIGLRLSLADLGHLGLQTLPLVIVIVVSGLAITLGLARVFGANARLAALLAAGTAICGASAIAAAAPGLRARSDEVCYAIACVALIGLTATVLYPALLTFVLNEPRLVGFAMGVAIHDTAQVTAAAVFHEQTFQAEGTLVAATVTKLMRNSAMLVVIPALIWMTARHEPGGSTRVPFPLFIVAFVVLSGARTLGDAWLGAGHEAWTQVITIAGHLSLFAFAMAMAALAMAVQPSELRGIGWKPAAAAVLAAALMLVLATVWIRFGIEPAPSAGPAIAEHATAALAAATDSGMAP